MKREKHADSYSCAPIRANRATPVVFFQKDDRKENKISLLTAKMMCGDVIAVVVQTKEKENEEGTYRENGYEGL